MRALVQRVSRAAVRVDDEVVGEIGPGLLVLLGVTHGDDDAVCDRLADKVGALRVFEDAGGKMNEALGDRGILVVSQFTLYGDARKGNRPSFVAAAPPEVAEPLYERFRARLGAAGRALRRAHGRRARERRSGDAAARAVLVGCTVMPPEIRVVPRFAAEPTQELLPYGRWAERLQEELLAACLRIDPGEADELGELGEITWYPDRTWHGRTYVPATATTTTGLEVFGFVSYARAEADREPSAFHAVADATSETADANPDWTIDLCDEVVGTWRGEEGNVAAMTLVWGRPLVAGAAIATRRARARCASTSAPSSTGASRCWRPTTTAPTRSRSRCTSAAGARSRASRSTPRTTTRTPGPDGDGRRGGHPHASHAQGVRAGARRPGDARGAARPRPLGAEPPPDEPVALSRPGAAGARAR